MTHHAHAQIKKGRGTYDNDRPPIVGTVGRETGLVRLEVKHTTRKRDLLAQIDAFTQPYTVCYTDEWKGYKGMKRTHLTVCHGKKEYARDADNDGVREVHTNTIEGVWTSLRNFLRPFRGVHKKFLYLYVAIFEITYNHKKISQQVVQAACLNNRILTT